MRDGPRGHGRARPLHEDVCSDTGCSAVGVGGPHLLDAQTGFTSARPSETPLRGALGHHAGHGHGVGVGERHVPAASRRARRSARRPCPTGRAPRRAVLGPHHLDVAEGRRPDAHAERLHHRLLGGEARRQARAGVAHSAGVRPARSSVNSRSHDAGAARRGPGGTGPRRRRRRRCHRRRPAPRRRRAASLHRDGLGQVAGPVDVVAVQPGDVVGEQLERHDVDHRGEQRVRSWGPTGRRRPGPRCPRRRRWPRAPPWRPAARTSATLPIIFSHRWVRVATPTTTVPGTMRAMGPCLSSPAGIALGPHVGDLLQLERALERHGEPDVAAEEEEVTGVDELAGDGGDVGLALGGEGRLAPARAARPARRRARGRRPATASPRSWARYSASSSSATIWARCVLVAATPDLGPGAGVEHAVGLARHGGVDDVGDHHDLRAPLRAPRAWPGAVSMVSPDWLTPTTSVRSSSTGSR